MLRPTALTMPAVVVSGRLNGLPIATTGSPTCAVLELANGIGCSSRGRDVDLDYRDVGGRVGAEHLCGNAKPVLEVDPDAARVGDDVLVGEDVALLVVDDARALALLLLGASLPSQSSHWTAASEMTVMSTTPGLSRR